MEIEQLDEVLESLLFVSGNGLSINEIVELLELQKSEVNSSIKRLKVKYGGKCGIHLLTYGGKIQFGTNPDYADIVSSVLNPIKEKELSNATLETVAIIAYKQPVTRLEIEQIRGVNCDYAVQVLLKHNLIEVVGRKDVIGKPLLFGTTEGFLKRFRIEDISQLPDYEQLLESISVLRSKDSVEGEASLYNEFEIPDEGATISENTSDKNPDNQANSNDNSGTKNLNDGDESSGDATDAGNDASNNDDTISDNDTSSDDDTGSDGNGDFDDFLEEEIPDFLKNEKDLQKIE